MPTFQCLFVNVCNYTFAEEAVVPLGQLSLASLLTQKMQDLVARVVDLNYLYSSGLLKRSKNLRDMLADSADYLLGNFKSDFISLYTMCNTHHFAILLAREIKRQDPECTICLAGPQAEL